MLYMFDFCLQFHNDDAKLIFGVPLAGTCLQDYNILSKESKEVVCMRAMGLLEMTKVEGAVKGFISKMNAKAGAHKPFKGHRGMDTAKLVEMVAIWSLDTKFVVLRDILPIRDGI